jgi:chemotaxis methyl-accepting protein methylase
MDRSRWKVRKRRHSRSLGRDGFTGNRNIKIAKEISITASAESRKTFAKQLINFYLRLNARLWERLPAFLTDCRPVRSYGNLLHALARRHGYRAQALSTFFLRNRPLLELTRRLMERRAANETVRVAVLGCSTGVEAYSIAWRIRSARPDLRLTLHAVDISRRAVEFGKSGSYSLLAPQLTDTDIFERMNETEMKEFFDGDGDVVTVKSWISEAITWRVGDVAAPETIDSLGLHDIVTANNFLCHLPPLIAENSLRNIARFVRPYGYLFVSGIDLDVRARVAAELKWLPVEELIEEIHDGDPCNRGLWPFHYAGLEPLDKKRQDWKRRYAAAFQVLPCNEKTHDSVDCSSWASAVKSADVLS